MTYNVFGGMLHLANLTPTASIEATLSYTTVHETVKL